jgi:Mononegavirales RNA dependent RNA polymerase
VDPLFKTIEDLFGLKGLYTFTHKFFEKCHFLLNHNCHPPLIGADNKPLPGEDCHMYQSGGCEGLRQKGWTVATIMMVLMAIEDAGASATVLGQGDNQVVIASLHSETQNEQRDEARALTASISRIFTRAGLPL